MERYDETTYGECIAEAYDDLYGSIEKSAVDRLQELAGRGRALELGIGTGRVALPLHERGIPVTGIDASPAMLESLRSKPGASGIEVVLGSFARIDLETRFDLVYVVFNTFFNLLTQEEQVGCFQSVSDHLTPNGSFVIEAFVPDLKRFEKGKMVRLNHVTEEEARLEVAQHDPLAQQVSSQLVVLSKKESRSYPVKLRYAWPPELDLMAKLAGLKLRHRWGDWDRGEFTWESGKHVSVYGRE
jgi:SAM-dependent methyltransferase